MVNRRQRNKNYKTYANEFKRIVEQKIPVKGIKYDTEVIEVIENVEEYRQCYRKGFKILEDLPRYWFVSKEGFLISLSDNEPIFVSPNLDSDRPQFAVSNHGKKHNIASYGLVGLVWGSYIEPDAYKMLFDNGIKCLGANRINKKREQIAKVQAHHTAEGGYIKEKTLENYIINNRPEYIQFLTNKNHTIVGNLSGDWIADTKRISKADAKYKAVSDTVLKVYQYAETNTKTDTTRKIPKVLTPEEYKKMIYNIINVKVEYLEKDCIKKDGYIFLREDSRQWLEDNLQILLFTAKEYPPQSKDYSKNIMECNGNIVYYGYTE